MQARDFRTSCSAPMRSSMKGGSSTLFTSDSCDCCVAFLCESCYQNCKCSFLHCSRVKDVLKELAFVFGAFAAILCPVWEDSSCSVRFLGLAKKEKWLVDVTNKMTTTFRG